MNEKYLVDWTNRFKKDYKRAIKRGCDISKMNYQIHEDILVLELTRTGSHSDLL